MNVKNKLVYEVYKLYEIQDREKEKPENFHSCE